MTTYRVKVRFPSRDPVGGLATEGVTVEGVPLGRTLVLTCRGEPQALASVAQRAGPAHSLRSSSASPGSVTLVVETPPAFEDLLRVLSGADGLLLPPVAWSEGSMTIEALVPEARVLVDALAGAELLGITPVPGARAALPDAAWAPRLTPRQAQALCVALEMGYYDSPRGATAGQVAAAMGVGRSTFEEHLRAAEGAAIRLLAPILRLQAAEDEPAGDAARADALQTYARFSHALGLYVEVGIRRERVASLRLVEKPAAPGGGGTHPHLEAVLRHIETGAAADVPIEGPEPGFRADVYAALRAIPPGETATYAEVAASVGRPDAARAVGTACAQNPVLVLVPCHRVVPASGALGAYAGDGGARTKARLLELERGRRAAEP